MSRIKPLNNPRNHSGEWGKSSTGRICGTDKVLVWSKSGERIIEDESGDNDDAELTRVKEGVGSVRRVSASYSNRV